MVTEREAMTLEQVRDRLVNRRRKCDYWNAQEEDQAFADAIDARLSRDAEPVAWFEKSKHGDFPLLLWRADYVAKVGDKLYTHPPEPARDANRWRQVWIDERAYRYRRAGGMNTEWARLNAEADANRIDAAMAQEH